MTKRLLILTTVLSIAIQGIALGEGRAKRTRSVDIAYAGFMVDTPSGGVAADCNGTGCVQSAARGAERFVSVKVVDASGLQVAAFAETLTGARHYFCGEMYLPMVIDPGRTVTVGIPAIPVDTVPCAGVGTTGTVEITFSNRT